MRAILPLLLVACSAPGPRERDPPALDPALEAALQEALDRARVAIDAPGATVAVRLPDGAIGVLASGLADRGGVAARPEHPFRIGSITKGFVAATLVLLHDEGAVDLDAPVADLLPGLPFADRMTLRQNLAHTAGWDDYAWQPDFVCCLSEPHTPEELVALVDEALLFEPGTAWEYSNTGYAVAGLAIETATGQDYAAVIAERFLRDLDVAFPSEHPMPAELARGYLGSSASGFVDVTDLLDPTNPWASGEAVTDAATLARWGHALYVDGALTPEQRDVLLTEATTDDGAPTGYALGTYLEVLEGRSTVGHSGSTHGFQSRLRVRIDGERSWVVATLANSFTAEADGIDAAIWSALVDHGEVP